MIRSAISLTTQPTPKELSALQTSLLELKDAGADGFVFGFLNESGAGVRKENCTVLLEAAKPLPCTFHKAFDLIPIENMEEELEVLIQLGFTSVLTSGGAATAVGGIDVLRSLVDRAKGRIAIIVGGGVRAGNIRDLKEQIGATWWHSAAYDGVPGEFVGEDVKGMRKVLEQTHS